MRQHNGMRPQDIVILTKLVCMRDRVWQYRDLSAALFIPISEISESLNRSSKAGLYIADLRKVNRLSFREFLEYGLKYVFPCSAGEMVTGISTAHSHPYFKKFIKGEMEYVWPYLDGKVRGLRIDPLHPRLPEAALKDADFYKLMASLDILRIGRVRELHVAKKVLKEAML